MSLNDAINAFRKGDAVGTTPQTTTRGKYLVVFEEDNGRLYVKNQRFHTFVEAEKYRLSIAIDRDPKIYKEV